MCQNEHRLKEITALLCTAQDGAEGQQMATKDGVTNCSCLPRTEGSSRMRNFQLKSRHHWSNKNCWSLGVTDSMKGRHLLTERTVQWEVMSLLSGHVQAQLGMRLTLKGMWVLMTFKAKTTSGVWDFIHVEGIGEMRR